MELDSAVGGKVLEVLTESYDASGAPSIEFLCELQDTKLNRNNRYYDEACLHKISSTLGPKSANYGLIGELNHPFIESTDKNVLIKRAARLDLENACVAYTDLRLDGNRIIAKAKTLRHPKGYIAKSYIEDDIGNIGFSSRSLGSVGPGNIVNAHSLTAFTYDFVWRPSHANAVITSIITESESGYELLKSLQSEAEQIVDLMESEGYSEILRADSNATEGDCGCIGNQCNIITESNLKSVKDIILEMEAQYLSTGIPKVRFNLN